MSPTHPWPSLVGYTTYGYIILLVYIIWKYNLLKLIFFDNVEVYFYIEVGLSTSNEESKGETLRHMTWAKAHLMVVGGLLIRPITELGSTIRSESYTQLLRYDS